MGVQEVFDSWGSLVFNAYINVDTTDSLEIILRWTEFVSFEVIIDSFLGSGRPSLNRIYAGFLGEVIENFDIAIEDH
jgi:hypothetical protein